MELKNLESFKDEIKYLEEAEEYAEDFVKDKYGGNRHCVEVQKEKLFLKIGFQDGLKAGRPQWHYLTEDPNDLPDTDRNVWVKRESEIECQIDNYYEDDKGWGIMFREGYCTDDVIAWCEIPTFDKESE